MRFTLRSMLYTLALLAAAYVAIGAGGIFVAFVVTWFWARKFDSIQTHKSIGCLVVLGIVLLLISFLIPAFREARDAAINSYCMSNLKQLSNSMHSYNSRNKSFPPAIVTDSNGVKLYSWRVPVLPDLAEKPLYDLFALDEPWDSAINLPSTTLATPLTCSSGKTSEDQTNYFVVADPKTMFTNAKGIQEKDITDGLSNTLMLMEVHGKKVNWAEPYALSFDEAIDILTTTDPKKAGCAHHHQISKWLGIYQLDYYKRNIALADGRVTTLPMGIPKEMAIALLTKSGGEDFDIDDLYKDRFELPWRFVWTQIYALAVFMIIVLLPAPWLIRYRRIKRDDVRSPRKMRKEC